MPRRKKLPPGAIPRVCLKCGQHFLAMTEREWEHNRRQHELLSKKHNPYPLSQPAPYVEPNIKETAGQPSRRWGKKFAPTVRVRGREEGPGSFRGRMGMVIGYVSGSGYLVRFDDGREEYVYAHWLEAA